MRDAWLGEDIPLPTGQAHLLVLQSRSLATQPFVIAVAGSQDWQIDATEKPCFRVWALFSM